MKTLLWRIALKFFVNPNKIVKVHEGYKMHLDSKDSLLLSLRPNYEPEHVEFMKKNIKKGDIAIDIGANIGYYTILLSKLVGENGKVFAFEPDPNNFKVLKENIKLNNLKNVIIENKAVSNKNGKIHLYFSKINSGDSRVYKTLEDREKVEVNCITLDNYFKNTKIRPSFIKIDTQGYEPAIFEGMNKLIKNKNIIITAEFFPEGLKSAGFNPLHFLESLKNNGFELFDLEDNKKIELYAGLFVLPIKYKHSFTTLIIK